MAPCGRSSAHRSSPMRRTLPMSASNSPLRLSVWWTVLAIGGLVLIGSCRMEGKECAFDSDCKDGRVCLSWTRPAGCHAVLASSCGIPCDRQEDCAPGLICFHWDHHGPATGTCEPPLRADGGVPAGAIR